MEEVEETIGPGEAPFRPRRKRPASEGKRANARFRKSVRAFVETSQAGEVSRLETAPA